MCDGVVYCNGAKGKLPCSTDLSNGHSVAVRVKQDGFLEYIVNGIVKANIIGNLPKDQPLWGFVELSGYVVAIQSEFYFQFGECYVSTCICTQSPLLQTPRYWTLSVSQKSPYVRTYTMYNSLQYYK